MTAVSERFDVRQRTFYLEIIIQPGLANASEVFGRQPVVEVRDVGTRARATPLKTTWKVTASLYYNPKPGRSVLKGILSVIVSGERALFSDLMITEYGEGYVLRFESKTGPNVLSDGFKVCKVYYLRIWTTKRIAFVCINSKSALNNSYFL
jgi:hypothetical protein